MKKLGLFALVMGLVMAFALPAFSFTYEGAKEGKLYIGGSAVTDLGYWNRSKEFAAAGWGGNSDQTQLIFDLTRATQLRTSFEMGNAGAYFELGYGRDNIAAQKQTEAANGADKSWAYNYAETRRIYGYYKFGNCEFRAGKDTGSFTALYPAQMIGYNNNGHIVLVGWGSLWDDRSVQARFSQDISKTFGYQVSIIQPAVYAEKPAATNIDSYAVLPRMDAMFKLNFGVVSLFPAVSFQTVKWDNLPSGADDSLTTWAAQLPLKVLAGPFTGLFSVGMGQNISGQYSATESAFQKYGRTADGKIKNTTGIFGFIDLSYTAGPVTPHLIFGYDQAKNDDIYVGDKSNTRLAYVANVFYKVSPNFTIIPEFGYYDYGKNPAVVGNPDIGKEWLGGVQFNFSF